MPQKGGLKTVRMNGRSRASVQTRSSGVALLVVDDKTMRPRSARRAFERTARELSAKVIVDLRAIGIPSSVQWGAIAAGVRALVRRGRQVTVYADAGLQRLLEISGFARDVNVVLLGAAAAA